MEKAQGIEVEQYVGGGRDITKSRGCIKNEIAKDRMLCAEKSPLMMKHVPWID